MTGWIRSVVVLCLQGAVLLETGFAAMTVEIAPEGQLLIDFGEEWRFFKGTTDPSTPPDAWKEPDFIDTGWETGPSGFGYGDDDDETPLDDMYDNYVTVYIRKEFFVTKPVLGDTLELVISYDDGFIIYLNGNELRREYMPQGAVDYQTEASSHEADEFETFPLGSSAILLQDGRNVIAIEGHNTSDTSTDFSLEPALRTATEIGKDGETWIVGSETVVLSCSTTVPEVASVTINGIDAAFDGTSGTWQGEVTLSPGVNHVAVEGLDAGDAVVDTGAADILYVPASQQLGGTLPGDTTLTTAAGSYIVTNDLTVPAGTTLGIEPGVTVYVKSGLSIFVYGAVAAEGTEGEPIHFTHYGEDGWWKQIMFIEAADSRFAHCFFQYAGRAGEHQQYYEPGDRDYYEAVVVLASRVDFEACTFRWLPDAPSGEGDALAIISDDPDYPGAATSHITGCNFLYIGQGVHTRYSYVLVEHCYFEGKTGDNDDVDLYGESDPPPLIQYNHFGLPEHDDRINPTKCSAIIIGNIIDGSDDHGIVLRDVGSPIAMNNVIRNCNSGGIAIENSCTAVLVNNTIYNSRRGLRLFDLGRWGPPYRLNPGGGTATVINSIIWDCDDSITLADSDNTEIEDKGSHITVIHCDIEGGEAGISVSGPESTVTWHDGNIDADPLFVDPVNGDFRLQAGSPAIDAGTLEEAPSTDADGYDRPCGDAVDIGAYEAGECWGSRILFRRADANSNGRITIGDTIIILVKIFRSGTGITCQDAADVDDNGKVELLDAVSILSYIFTGLPLPEGPFGECGEDQKVDILPECVDPSCAPGG